MFRADRPGPAVDVRAAASRDLWPALAAAAAGLAFWLSFVAWQGFHLSPDSMSYAALARGFDTGHPFTSGIYWRGSVPGRLQANWPPLYPIAIALVHLSGLPFAVCEFALSGVAVALACGFGAAAVRRAAGGFPWAAALVLGGFYDLLAVAAWGWTEPGFDALLSLHVWLCARAGQGGRGRARLLFWAGLVVGLMYLQRYAAVPFGLAAVLFAAAAGASDGPRRAAGATRGAAAMALGAALPSVPWTVAALAATGHLGTAYLPVGAGWAGAWHMARQAGRLALEAMLQPGLPGAPAPASFLGPAMWATAVAVGVGLAVAAAPAVRELRVARGGAPQGGAGPWLLLALLSADAVGHTLLVTWLRARYFFDAIDLRLLAPSLWPLLLAVVLAVAMLPWAARQFAAIPVAALMLWHGVGMARAGAVSPQIAASLSGPWCSPGLNGDCSLFDWLSTHVTTADLLVTDAPFTINFQLALPVEQVSSYAYSPFTRPADLRRWAAGWRRAHPGGSVYVVVDQAVGPVDAVSYGQLFAAMASAERVPLGGGVSAGLVAEGSAWRVLKLAGLGPG